MLTLLSNDMPSKMNTLAVALPGCETKPELSLLLLQCGCIQ